MGDFFSPASRNPQIKLRSSGAPRKAALLALRAQGRSWRTIAAIGPRRERRKNYGPVPSEGGTPRRGSDRLRRAVLTLWP